MPVRDDSPADLPFWAWTAEALTAGYARGSAMPSQVLAAILARSEAVNPLLNAVIALDRAGAERAAEASDARWKTGSALGPLDGVPVTIKDNMWVAGLPAVWGSALFADHVPSLDETPVARLRAAGAVFLGKTNVPEFTVQGFTDNAIFGPTRNPWNRALTPGGSSGGAVAAVAGGIGPLALCTDGGGSIRRPAGHTGLVGLKPSRGTVPRRHGFPAILNDFEVAGPIGRTVADLRAMMQVIAEPGSFAGQTPPATLRIAHIPTFADAPVDPAIAASVASAAATFAELGHSVERLDDFRLAEALNAIWPIVSETGIAWLLDHHSSSEQRVGTAAAGMAQRGRLYGARDYLDMLMVITQAGEAFTDLFGRFDLLLLPSAAAQPWPIGDTHPSTIAGRPVGPRGHAMFTAFANALGLPALTLPARPDASGLPIGFQLAGPLGSDDLLLSMGVAYEAAQGPFPMPNLG